jgi:hypothetical protein
MNALLVSIFCQPASEASKILTQVGARIPCFQEKPFSNAYKKTQEPKKFSGNLLLVFDLK